jgi:hypothetical protein
MKKKYTVPVELYLNAYLRSDDIIKDDKDPQKRTDYLESIEAIRQFEAGKGTQETLDKITTQLIERNPEVKNLLNDFHGKERK